MKKKLVLTQKNQVFKLISQKSAMKMLKNHKIML